MANDMVNNNNQPLICHKYRPKKTVQNSKNELSRHNLNTSFLWFNRLSHNIVYIEEGMSR